MQRLFSDQRKELDEERIMTEEERRKVELDKISIDSKMKKIDEREAMINMSEKDLRKKVIRLRFYPVSRDEKKL